MIAELQSEKEAIDDAILVLERLANTRGKRRGRPPLWMSVVRDAGRAETRRTRVFSAETRKRMAEAQKKRWAAFRKAQPGATSK